jgi:WD40 repeat protein
MRWWRESCARRDDWNCAQTLQHHKGTVWDVTSFKVGGGCAADEGAVSAPVLCSCSEDGSLAFWSLDTEHGAMPQWQVVGVKRDLSSQPIFSVDAIVTDSFNVLLQNSDVPTVIVAGAAGDNSVSLLEVYENNGDGVHDIAAATVWKKENAHDADVNCVRFRPSTESVMFATCGDDNVIRIWEVILGPEKDEG